MRAHEIVVEAVWHRGLDGRWVGTKPRVFWRGTNPDSTERIKTGDESWDALLFVASDPASARSYGTQLERIIAKPEAKILYQGTREFSRLSAGLKGSMLAFVSAVVTRAKAQGYDAVWFERQGDVGTAIINPEAFTRNA